MGVRVHENTRRKVLEMLEANRPYRAIQKELGVGMGIIAAVRRAAGQRKRPQQENQSAPSAQSAALQPAPSAPGAVRAGTQQEGNGLSEFQPERAPGALPRAAAQEENASGPERAQKRSEQRSAERSEPYQCGVCSIQWTLDEGEEPVMNCPGCGVALEVESGGDSQ